MFLKKSEFIGASIPQNLFQVSQTCIECQQPADLTVLITDAWGTYRKISLCKLHWEQTTKQDNTNEPEPLKVPAAQPELSRQKPGSVVPWPRKLKHGAFILTLFLAGAGTATSQTQRGQLSVTASIESSATYSQGPDGKWTLIVANARDSATVFVPKLRLTSRSEAAKLQKTSSGGASGNEVCSAEKAFFSCGSCRGFSSNTVRPSVCSSSLVSIYRIEIKSDTAVRVCPWPWRLPWSAIACCSDRQARRIQAPEHDRQCSLDSGLRFCLWLDADVHARKPPWRRGSS